MRPRWKQGANSWQVQKAKKNKLYWKLCKKKEKKKPVILSLQNMAAAKLSWLPKGLKFYT